MAIAVRQTTLGPLNARVVDDPTRTTPPELVVILCHGYGAPGDDLVDLGAELLQQAPALVGRVRFIFPEAPLALDNVPFGGRAWWPIDMLALQQAIERGEERRMADEVPAGLAAARQKLRALIEAVHVETKLPFNKIVLGGFSQGAMVTTDAALRLEEAPAALLVFSGALLDQSEWKKLAGKRAGLKVLQAHGTSDPILPFNGAVALRDVLKAAGLVVDFHEFRGGHTIDRRSLQAAATLLSSLL
ncbi:MAG TPA: phospholipase [Myxococcota bacterium]